MYERGRAPWRAQIPGGDRGAYFRCVAEAVLEKGYENTTIQDIIDALGNLSKGAIYHHFKSKEDILEAVCDQRLFAGVEALMNEVVTDKRLNGAGKNLPVCLRRRSRTRSRVSFFPQRRT